MTFAMYNKPPLKPSEPTIYETLFNKLREIKTEKDWTDEEAGTKFAEVLTKGPAMMPYDGGYDYYDEYGPEDYEDYGQVRAGYNRGATGLRLGNNNKSGVNRLTGTAAKNAGNPMQNEKLKKTIAGRGGKVTGQGSPGLRGTQAARGKDL